MYASTFHYAITRPFPYRWFTWVTVIGGVCAIVLFSVINLAANGYNLVNTYTTDFNGTLAQKRWTSTFPFSLVERSTASCQAQDLPVDSQFYTNKLGFSYTLVSVWQERNGIKSILPSLRYSNNTLDNCSISFIGTDLESNQRTAEQQGWTGWGPKAFVGYTPPKGQF